MCGGRPLEPLSSNPLVHPRTPQKEGKAAHRHLAHTQPTLVTNNVLTVLFEMALSPFFSLALLQGRQQQRGANPGCGQQERSAATALHASQGSVSPGEEDLEVWLRGVLCQVQLARSPALQGAAGHRCGTRHAPEPHVHPSAGGASEEPLHHHVTLRAPSTLFTSGVEVEKRTFDLNGWKNTLWPLALLS